MRLPRTTLALILLAACAGSGSTNGATPTTDDSKGRLPTGARLDPAGELHPVGQMPLAMLEAPEGDRVVLLLNGWRDEGIQVVERTSGKVLQTVPLPASFLGLAFARDGRRLYASGGNTDNIYIFDWQNGAAKLADSIVLQARATPRANGVRYPAGIALSGDGRMLYVAENLGDSLAVVDVAAKQVIQRLPTGRAPYAVAETRDGKVYVTNWGNFHLSTFAPGANGRLVVSGDIPVGRHPSAIIANARGNRLFVALASVDRIVAVDVTRRRVIGELMDHPPTGPQEGSTPNALALSADGKRLFVAEADANAVAVFDLTASTSGIPDATGDDRMTGRVPAGWYPSALYVHGDELIVASAKGRGTRANPDGPSPATARDKVQVPGRNTTLAQLAGAYMNVPLARTERSALSAYTARVERANGWTGERVSHRYPPIEHVIYIIKENRTYDQMLGDLTQADGDSTLTLFPRDVTPNHHALAERFGIFDRFFVNAEVSADGHNWSTAAYATDYVEKTVQFSYSQRGRSYDYEGTRGVGGKTVIDDDDVNSPAQGYLWDLANRKGITFRNYGEFVVPDKTDPDDVLPAGYRGNKPFLAAHTNTSFPGFGQGIPDQQRADVWIAELAEFSRRGMMPALEIIRLPNDHTSGASAGLPTPRAAVADNDLALGRMIEALSKTEFWKSTVVFVLEDDAQNGPDHVDSHRSPLLVISPWVRAGLVRRFANTTDVIRTMEELLGLDALSQFDHYGRPLREIWSDSPDVRGYSVITPKQRLDERNPGGTNGARQSGKLDLRIEDSADDDVFNRVIWEAVKPGVPYPGTRRAGALEALRP